ncbi:MAG TPA: alpha/beta fold hydrolase [Herbaspirillum sp.]|uniref:alpha/beta fold hydrolase n=1 Tax=Herbaspirillum sp. TaxID=1890675 RepID=UPI002D591965|nr:alpha/beta fold hydrolase [Herbaspirillum sp.]HZG18876.1 alpha/beta fold hydrolase [Herbaspirillum sp.]
MNADIAPLAADVLGRDDAQTVVLLHPICANREIWRLQVPVWSSSLRLVLVDLPGHGLSRPAVGPARLEDFAHRLAGTLERAGIGQVSLVGVSLGAMLAQAFALAYPERISKLVLANAGAVTPQPVVELWNERQRNYRELGVEQHVRSTMARWFDDDYRGRAPLTVQWIESMVRGTTGEGYFHAVDAIKGMDHGARLREISAPTLVVAGEKDAAVKPEICAKLAQAVDGARLVRLPCGHISNVEAAAEFTEVVGQFLLD